MDIEDDTPDSNNERKKRNHRAVVHMYELITTSLSDGNDDTNARSQGRFGKIKFRRSTKKNNATMSIQRLVALMDICTCASAEKHCGVQCVTVSMGDVVFEYMPQKGEIVELLARPVLVGRTSLNISLSVYAISSGSEEDLNERKHVCDAYFTYVTTRGPNGEKRFCPPLEPLYEDDDDPNDADEQMGVGVSDIDRWDRIMANFRKSMMATEVKLLKENEAEFEEDNDEQFDFEMSEVVLPAHQNHMGHTFGGVIMSWMAKAALVACTKRWNVSVSDLRVEAIQRVSFSTGSDVSDHLVFRPRINSTQILDVHSAVEVEVNVAKRCIASGSETHMNIGYFYIRSVVPATLSSSEETMSNNSDQVEYRLRHFIARRCLLASSSITTAVEWHPSLSDEVPLLTILSALRLVHHDDSSVEWKRALPDTSSSLKNKMSMRVASLSSSHLIEWSPGSAWGRGDRTFVIRCKFLIVPNEYTFSSPDASITSEEVLRVLRDHRRDWDHLCERVERIDTETGDVLNSSSSSSSSVEWDIVEHQARTPHRARLASFLRTCQPPDTVVPLCLLRAWKINRPTEVVVVDDDYANNEDENDDDDDDDAKDNVETKTGETTAVFASRSVIHPNTSTSVKTEVFPSGWFLRDIIIEEGNEQEQQEEHNEKKNRGVEVTYVAEHDLERLRRVVGLSDKMIVSFMASALSKWIDKLTSFNYSLLEKEHLV